MIAAERLAWLCGSISWLHFFEELAGGLANEGITLPCRPPAPTEAVALSRDDVLALLAIHMASEAEYSRGELGEPGVWLSRVSRAGSYLRRNLSSCLPPVFASCSQVIEPDVEMQAREDYLAGLKVIPSNIDAAEQKFSSAVERCPWVAEPLVWRALLAVVRMDFGLAESLSAQACELLRQWATPWDKRLTCAEWLWLLTAMRRWTDRDASLGSFITPQSEDPRDFVRFLRHAAPDPNPGNDLFGPLRQASSAAVSRDSSASLNSPPRSRLDRFLYSFQHNHRAPSMPFYPELSSRPWYDAERFAITRALKENFASIRREALAIDRNAYHPESESIVRSGDWDVFMLYEGRKNAANCAACPVTTQVIESSAAFRKSAGVAYFSRMSPGTHIASHRGPTNMRIRCHLGIEIPEGDCCLRVGAEIRTWRVGECLVFDDSLDHEVWNLTDSPRIVLIVDLWHPGLEPEEVAVLEGMHRYAVHSAESLQRYWEQDAAARRLRNPD